MITELETALAELDQAGAQNLPTESEILAAADGTTWHDRKADGGEWSLTKNSDRSYDCLC